MTININISETDRVKKATVDEYGRVVAGKEFAGRVGLLIVTQDDEVCLALRPEDQTDDEPPSPTRNIFPSPRNYAK